MFNETKDAPPGIQTTTWLLIQERWKPSTIWPLVPLGDLWFSGLTAPWKTLHCASSWFIKNPHGLLKFLEGIFFSRSDKNALVFNRATFPITYTWLKRELENRRFSTGSKKSRIADVLKPGGLSNGEKKQAVFIGYDNVFRCYRIVPTRVADTGWPPNGWSNVFRKRDLLKTE